MVLFKRGALQGTIHIIFEDTRGETCLRVDFSSSNEMPVFLSDKPLSLSGSLELDLIPLTRFLEVDLNKMKGSGKLEHVK